MRTTQAQRELLAVTVTADLASTFLQPGFAGPHLTTEKTRDIILGNVDTQAFLNGIPKKHVKDMQQAAGAFFDRHFRPLYVLYFEAKE